MANKSIKSNAFKGGKLNQKTIKKQPRNFKDLTEPNQVFCQKKFANVAIRQLIKSLPEQYKNKGDLLDGNRFKNNFIFISVL